MGASSELTRAVLQVGGGRGFVVRCRNRGWDERIVITAALGCGTDS